MALSYILTREVIRANCVTPLEGENWVTRL